MNSRKVYILPLVQLETMAEEIGNPELINIDPEFQALIPALRKIEVQRLEELIKVQGCKDALKVWDHDGRLWLLDGHHRFEICTHATPQIPFNIDRVVGINNRDDAIKYMILNQIARRNFNEIQFADFIGRLFELEKKKVGKPASSKLPQEEGITDGETAEKIARENKISRATVERDTSLHRDLSQIEKVAPSLSESIKDKSQRVSRPEIKTLAQKSPEEIKKIEQKVIGGSPLKEVLRQDTKSKPESKPAKVVDKDLVIIRSMKDFLKETMAVDGRLNWIAD